MNVASRTQSTAAAGEILVTQAVYERAQSELAGRRPQQLELKGFDEWSTTLYAAREGPSALDLGYTNWEKIEQVQRLPATVHDPGCVKTRDLL